jgi:hypothetical protein
MLRDRIDVSRLRADIVSASAECRALKQALRRTWAAPMADEQRRLARVARRVTDLCILRARMRGRWHVTTPPRDLRGPGASWDRDAFHARIADRVALDYVLPAAPAAEPRAEAAP